MTGTVRAVEKEDYHPTKPIKVVPKVKVSVEHPKYKRAGPGGKCKRCGKVMKVLHRMPSGKGRTHVTYWCEKCNRPRVGME